MRVPVAIMLNVPVYVTVIPATSVTLPETEIPSVPARVPVNPVQLMDLAPVLPVAMVTTAAPEAASKYTSSADVGTVSPPGPPEVSAHFVPAVPSQFAVPPTQ